MPVVVNYQPLLRRYYASGCSLACAFCTVTVLATALIPLFLGVVSKSFWLSDAIRFEQPNIVLTNDLVVRATGSKTLTTTGTTAPLELVWSTSPRLNALLPPSSVRAPIVRSAVEDTTGDARMDEFRLSVAFPLGPDEQISGVSVCARASIGLSAEARLHTDGAIMVSGSAGASSAMHMDGEIVLRQRQRLPASGRLLDPDFGVPALDLSTITDPAAALPATLHRAISARNVTIRLDGAASWTPEGGYTPVPAGTTGAVTGRTFTASLTARVNPQPVWVQPSLPEVLKAAWVQYVALLLPVFFVLWWLSCVLFDTGVVDAASEEDRAGKFKRA